jgi:type II restriction/modification system DNA methylase subunit YeeA
VKRVVNAADILRRSRNYWTIDFGPHMPQVEAALYEMPFEYVRKYVLPERASNNRKAYRERWWIYAEARTGMRKALAPLLRYLATPRIAKHRVFVWVDADVMCNDAIIVFTRDDDYFFGVLHSRVHELWSLRMGTSLEDRPRYTPTSTFETFPFPWPPGDEPEGDSRIEAVAEAARRLDNLRRNWLNPEGASEAELKKRTLTNLYNARPTWLQNAHERLDEAVFAAYGWPPELSDEEVLQNLLALNLERAGERGRRDGPS